MVCFDAGERSGRARPIAYLLAGLAIFILLVAHPDAAVAQNPVDVSLPEVGGEQGETTRIPVEVSDLSGRDVIAFGFTVSYDPDVVDMVGAVSEGTLSEEMLVKANTPEPGQLKVGAATSTALSGAGTLLYLEAELVAEGESALEWIAFEFNDGHPSVELTDGSLRDRRTNEQQRQVPAGDPPPILLGDLGTELDFSGVGAASTVIVRQFGFAPGGDAPHGFDLSGETFWNIELTGTSAFTVDVCFALDRFSGNLTAGALQVIKRSSARGEWETVRTELRSVAQQPVQICAMGMTSLSDFAVASSRAPVFPPEPVLIVPEAGAEIVLAGDPETPLAVSWHAAEDLEGDTLAYTWQLALTSDFTGLLMEQSTEETQLQTTYRTLAVQLDERGVGVGETVTVHHRVSVTDGDLTTTSEGAAFTLVRDVLTDAERTEVPEVFSLAQNHPNPFSTETTIPLHAARRCTRDPACVRCVGPRGHDAGRGSTGSWPLHDILRSRITPERGLPVPAPGG